MPRKILLCLLLFILIFQISSAASDDITLFSDVTPVYRLEKSFSQTVKCPDNSELTVTVSDVISETNRILVRFYITDVPEAMKAKITDDSRVYGSYLPVAEIADGKGLFLTPSSASKYSFLEYNSRLIIGGLMVFDTEAPLQAFYLNFNQIPFDTAPLSEGFTKALSLLSAGSAGSSGYAGELSCTASDLEFTIAASAQTSDVSMLQPTVRVLRGDETLSKFGWISISDTVSGKRYAVSRETLYGFNLSDDTVYSPAHAYVFNPILSDSPVEITMPDAWVVRSFEEPVTAELDLNGSFSGHRFTPQEDFSLYLSEISVKPEESKIRLYIDSEGRKIGDISFRFPELDALAQPSVYCGIDPETEKFACDLYFNDMAIPRSSLVIGITAAEYLKTGPWTLRWNPVPMDPSAERAAAVKTDPLPVIYGDPESERAYPDEVRSVLDSIRERSDQLTSEPGRIRESYLLDYTIGENTEQDLIPTDQYEQYYVRYISETYSAVDDKGELCEILTITRDPETDEILSAQQKKDGVTIDLIHALKVKTNTGIEKSYSCFAEFSDICSSSAVFLAEEDCTDGNTPMKCLRFYHSLTGTPDGKALQSIMFRIDPADNFIISSEIDYDHGTLFLRRDTLALEKAELPEDIRNLMDSIYE